MRFAALIIVIVAVLCASASAAAPMPNAAVACTACAQLAADAQDEVARQAVFAASCANVVAAQAQDTDSQETLSHMHTACVAEQSIMLDPKMLCADVLRCPVATTAAVRPMAVQAAQDQMPCDACIAKLMAKGVPADDAPKICMKVLKVPRSIKRIFLVVQYSRFAL